MSCQVWYVRNPGVAAGRVRFLLAHSREPTPTRPLTTTPLTTESAAGRAMRRQEVGTAQKKRGRGRSLVVVVVSTQHKQSRLPPALLPRRRRQKRRRRRRRERQEQMLHRSSSITTVQVLRVRDIRTKHLKNQTELCIIQHMHS